MFHSQKKLIGVTFGVVLEVFPSLRTSCDLVMIRQKLAFPADVGITEGLPLTRDQMTASTDIFRMGLIFYLVSSFHFPCIYSPMS